MSGKGEQARQTENKRQSRLQSQKEEKADDWLTQQITHTSHTRSLDHHEAEGGGKWGAAKMGEELYHWLDVTTAG